MNLKGKCDLEQDQILSPIPSSVCQKVEGSPPVVTGSYDDVCNGELCKQELHSCVTIHGLGNFVLHN